MEAIEQFEENIAIQRYTHVSNRDIRNVISPLDTISKGKYNEVVQ